MLFSNIVCETILKNLGYRLIALHHSVLRSENPDLSVSVPKMDFSALMLLRDKHDGCWAKQYEYCCQLFLWNFYGQFPSNVILISVYSVKNLHGPKYPWLPTYIARESSLCILHVHAPSTLLVIISSINLLANVGFLYRLPDLNRDEPSGSADFL